LTSANFEKVTLEDFNKDCEKILSILTHASRDNERLRNRVGDLETEIDEIKETLQIMNKTLAELRAERNQNSWGIIFLDLFKMYKCYRAIKFHQLSSE
jgi:predicted nuclease with TOPRIM domain